MASSTDPQADTVAGAESSPSVPQQALAPPTAAEPLELNTLSATTPSAAIETSKHDPRTLNLSLLLVSGARHPYTIDEKYLASRNFSPKNSAGEIDARELSGYQLKELIWTDWRSEWEPKPPTPSSIRLIILGRMIEDKGVLKDLPFKSSPGDSNVVHMTIRPADLEEPEDAPLASKYGLRQLSRAEQRERDQRERASGAEGPNSRREGSRCCVIL